MQPGHRGNEKQALHVVFLLDGGAGPGPLPLGSGIAHIVLPALRRVVAQGAVAIGAVFQQLNVGGVAALVLEDPFSPDPAAELRHGVGGLSRDPDEGQVEGPALFPAKPDEIRHVHVHGHAHVGIGGVAKVVKVGPAGGIGDVDFFVCHRANLSTELDVVSGSGTAGFSYKAKQRKIPFYVKL